MTFEKWKQDIIKFIRKYPARTHWQKAIRNDAECLMEDFENFDEENKIPESWDEFEYLLSQGYCNWNKFSRDGNASCYDYDIAEKYLTPAEFKKWRKEGYYPGDKNGTEQDWIDLQGIALEKAADIIRQAYEQTMTWKEVI